MMLDFNVNALAHALGFSTIKMHKTYYSYFGNRRLTEAAEIDVPVKTSCGTKNIHVSLREPQLGLVEFCVSSNIDIESLTNAPERKMILNLARAAIYEQLFSSRREAA